MTMGGRVCLHRPKKPPLAIRAAQHFIQPLMQVIRVLGYAAWHQHRRITQSAITMHWRPPWHGQQASRSVMLNSRGPLVATCQAIGDGACFAKKRSVVWRSSFDRGLRPRA